MLNAEEITLLLILLGDFEELFDGTSGDWSTESDDLVLQPYFKPFNRIYYPVTRFNKETFRKELKRLVEIGVLIPVQQSQYSTPVFIIPNKEGTARFITDYHRLNKKLVRKKNTLLTIVETMQQLEGFQYATSLDLNTGYYTTMFFPQFKTRQQLLLNFEILDVIAFLWACALPGISSKRR